MKEGPSLRKTIKRLHLDEFSTTSAQEIVDAFPDWEPYLARDEHEDGYKCTFTLRMEVPSVNPKVAEPLTITTGIDGILTIEWFRITESRRWEIDWLLGPQWERKLYPASSPKAESVTGWLQALVAEEIVACSFADDGAYGARLYADLEPLKAKHGTSLTVRSWAGTHDY